MCQGQTGAILGMNVNILGRHALHRDPFTVREVRLPDIPTRRQRFDTVFNPLYWDEHRRKRVSTFLVSRVYAVAVVYETFSAQAQAKELDLYQKECLKVRGMKQHKESFICSPN